jgi:hypothetical protein
MSISRRLCLAGACASLVGCSPFPSHTLNYRLKITVEVDGKRYSGSSVIRLSYFNNGLFKGFDALSDYSTTVSGEAAVVDMGAHGLLFGLLTGMGRVAGFRAQYPFEELRDEAGDFWPHDPSGLHASAQNHPEEVPIPFNKESHPQVFPVLARFKNLMDPGTLQMITPETFSTFYGSSARVIGATIQITDAEPEARIERVLPWLKNPNDNSARFEARSMFIKRSFLFVQE